MAYKDILLHLDESNECQERTRAAVSLAQNYEAHLVGFCPAVRPVVPAHVEVYMMSDIIQQQEKDAWKLAHEAKEQFQKAVSHLDLSTEYRAELCLEPELAKVLSAHARSTDLVVLSQSKDEDVPLGGRHLPEDVAMASGRPVLLVPYVGYGESIGQRVLVAWDGSREAARAVSDALPFLTAAESVVVMAVGNFQNGQSNSDDPAADIGRHLARHGCKVEVYATKAVNISIGDTMLSRCADLSSDLLVMGAYGHTRLKEMILGGVTRHILRHMTIPTLLSH